MGMGLRFQVVVFALAVVSSCSVSVQTRTEFSAPSTVKEAGQAAVLEPRYQITGDDLSSLKQNGLLDSESEAALAELQKLSKI